MPNFSYHFWKNKSVFLQILHQSSVQSNITHLYFFSSNIFYLVKKGPLKSKFLRHLGAQVKIGQIPQSILKQQVNSSPKFASYWNVLTYNSSVNFKLMDFLAWIKVTHKSPNFETLKCSSESVPYSSCHFRNHNPVFFQTFYHSSVSCKITLYFFRSNVIYFPQKEPIKVDIFRISNVLVKIHQILVIFETKNHFFIEFCITR